jgi:hypothetical protein
MYKTRRKLKMSLHVCIILFRPIAILKMADRPPNANEVCVGTKNDTVIAFSRSGLASISLLFLFRPAKRQVARVAQINPLAQVAQAKRSTLLWQW